MFSVSVALENHTLCRPHTLGNWVLGCGFAISGPVPGKLLKGSPLHKPVTELLKVQGLKGRGALLKTQILASNVTHDI